MAALLGLFWGLLREGRLKVARGRSWQPEIGMEHASRGRRSGNNGVGARLRGRFRIFSARHRFRTKVSHAENSGMTTVFFFGDCSGVGGRFFHTLGSGQTRMPPQSDGTRGSGFLVWGIVSHALERPHTAYRRWTVNTRGFDFFGLGDSFTSYPAPSGLPPNPLPQKESARTRRPQYPPSRCRFPPAATAAPPWWWRRMMIGCRQRFRAG